MRTITIRFIPFLILLTLTQFIFAQQVRNKVDYLNFVKHFYKSVFSKDQITTKDCSAFFFDDLLAEYEEKVFFENCHKKKIDEENCRKLFKSHYYNNPKSESVFFLKIKKQKADFIQGSNQLEINKIINDSSELIDIGEQDYLLLKISFPNRKFLYIALNKYLDERIVIVDIYLPDGESYLNHVFLGNSDYLTLPGKISDIDGYVNVRKEASVKSSIVGQIKVGELFYYTPNSNNSWWNVQKRDTHINGYVYYDRIKTITSTSN